MLRLKRRSALVAAASIFAALYAVLGAIPVSRLVLGSGNFLTASNFVTPLAGMIFGPFVGGFAAVVGDVLDVYAGYIVFGGTGVSIIAADLATVVTAGLAYKGRWKASLAVPLAVICLYWADPISVRFVGWVPFTWLHMVSVIPFAALLLLAKSGKVSRLNPAFVAAVTFASLLCGQLTGTLVGQELSVRLYHTLTLQDWQGIVPLFFPLYPVERTFFATVGTIVSVPVLRGLWRREHPHATG